MPPKDKRFTQKDFLKVRPKVFFRGLLLDVAYITLPSQKFACVISKKTLAKAVERNRVKRRIMNVLQTIDIQTQNSFVVYPKKTSKDAAYPLLGEEIKKAFDTLQ